MKLEKKLHLEVNTADVSFCCFLEMQNAISKMISIRKLSFKGHISALVNIQGIRSVF